MPPHRRDGIIRTITTPPHAPAWRTCSGKIASVSGIGSKHRDGSGIRHRPKLLQGAWPEGKSVVGDQRLFEHGNTLIELSDVDMRLFQLVQHAAHLVGDIERAAVFIGWAYIGQVTVR